VRADGVVLLTRFEDEHDNYRAALGWAERADDGTTMLRLATALTLFWELRGHTGEGCQWFARALARPSEQTVERARALWGAAHVAIYHDEEETARLLAREALDLAGVVDDRWTEARALNTIGYGETLWPEKDDPREVLERSIGFGRALGDDWVVADGLKMLSIGFMFRDDAAGVQRVVDELSTVATGIGNGFFLAWCDVAVALVAMHRGEFERARALLDAAIARGNAVGDPATGGLAVAYLSEVEAATGETAVARAHIDSFITHANARGAHLGVAPAAMVLLELMLGEGDFEGARLLAAGYVADVNFPTLLAWGGAVLGRASLEVGDLAAANGALVDALAVAERAESPWVIAKVQHVRGLVAQAAGERRDAEELWHTALALRQARGFAPGIAESLEALATIAADEESYDEATRLLAASAALRSRIGFVHQPVERVRYEAAVERLQRALGADAFAMTWSAGGSLTADDAVAYASRARGERKRPSSGWESLTPTEERVVSLVAEGLTNPQIAARLFVAPGTVKVHVSHVFTKLGLSTRSELAAAAARRTYASGP
jgi:DNA-binding CsgD family transcriptional regulator